MRNLLLGTLPILIMCIILFIWGIILIVKRYKNWIGVNVFFIIGIIGSLSTALPALKDISRQELVSFQGVYIEYSRNGEHSLVDCSTNTFVSQEGVEEYLIVPSLAFADYDLHKGQEYIITYYKYSHMVYSVEKIPNGDKDDLGFSSP